MDVGSKPRGRSDRDLTYVTFTGRFFAKLFSQHAVNRKWTSPGEVHSELKNWACNMAQSPISPIKLAAMFLFSNTHGYIYDEIMVMMVYYGLYR